ncbi:SEC-C domain-containing protein [Singulisphaera acidiphila]|uniref:SEC-C motif-containing protein n=1 Tax=Singulisphaera acidiphila (strain ATCC BAA-1392 / DSM 18658 / VKM B-2454 / MOB10) TaxID=886293 RepID=L0DNS5_SINAD|nr:SEC-C domain-containing protein [Singulisphaera acidiphila]AGA30336.1 SEC-C motif-containing protein [Singulisphaera acidiphila DSM 18658]
MAVVEPYAPCPCGSGQKFKWCCHKVENQAERAQRLFESGQVEAAVQVLDEGLRKEPDNAWLLTRKALYQVRLGQSDSAKASLRLVLRKNPKHFGAMTLLSRLVIATEGPSEGCLQLQQILSAFPATEIPALAPLVSFVASSLVRFTQYPAAIRHFSLAIVLGSPAEEIAQNIGAIQRDVSISPWLKNSDELAPAPESLSESTLERFNEALDWADGGLWSAAASAFEVLSEEKGASLEADRNAGLCRLWIADDDGAVEGLRRAIVRMGNTDEAVDLEALCQQLDTIETDDQVEQVQLIWPVSDQDRLLKALRNDPSIDEGDTGPIDPEAPESPVVVNFGFLDRPKLQTKNGLKPGDVPLFVGRIFVGQEIAGIETYDDGRLDGLVERFTTLAEGGIRPAHPKTKVINKVGKAGLALSWEWRLPDDIDSDERARLEQEQGAALIREVWPKTPMAYLGGRTPQEAAKAGDAVVPLRAALFQLESIRTHWRDSVDFAALRSSLGIQPEPEIDPETVEIETVHLSRLNLIPAERLDDDRLTALYWRARQFALDAVVEKTARVLVERPDLWEKAKVESFSLFSDLALLVAGNGKPDEAFEWVRKGRQADPAAKRAAYAPMWDMVEVRIKAREKSPEAWVPDLAVVLERYAGNPESTQAVMLNLLEMGLVRLTPNPDKQGDFLLDSRPLQMLMAEYGPRVTTASGRLGVSATKGEIWTPDKATGGGGGLWTPGSGSASAAEGGDKPKLIIPGR